jgi:hypothetical protein
METQDFVYAAVEKRCVLDVFDVEIGGGFHETD